MAALGPRVGDGDADADGGAGNCSKQIPNSFDSMLLSMVGQPRRQASPISV